MHTLQKTDDDIQNEYDVIDVHKDFSMRLFLTNKMGRHLLSELEKKPSSKMISTITHNMNEILNIRILSNNSMLLLLNCLDEILFFQVESLNHFYIDSSRYSLTQLYFNQTEWIDYQKIQIYKLDMEPDLNNNEAMLFVCFLRQYEDILLNIDEYISNNNDKIGKNQQRNFHMISRKIRIKMKIIWDFLLEIIRENFF